MTTQSEMIKCGWKGCENMFSTGIDMNQHVLINHIKFMKVQFVDPENSTAEPKSQATPRFQRNSGTRQSIPHIPTTLIRGTPSRMNPSSYSIPSTSTNRNLIADEKPQILDFFNDDVLIDKSPTRSTSAISETSRREKSNEREINSDIQTLDDFQDVVEETDIFSSHGIPEKNDNGPSPAKKSKRKSSAVLDENGEKLPWSIAKQATHIPQPEIRLATAYETVGLMAQAICLEVSARKTLRRKYQSINGNYCVVCLDYRKENGLCDFLHNNQHEHFIKYWKTLYGEEKLNKMILVQQLTEMGQIEDPLPLISTNIVSSSSR